MSGKATLTLTLIIGALGAFTLASYGQDGESRQAKVRKIAQSLYEAKQERARLDDRIFELTWCLAESRKNKDKPPVTALPKVELPALPDGHSWTKGGYFTGQVFIVDGSKKLSRDDIHKALSRYLGRKSRPTPPGAPVKKTLPEGLQLLDGTATVTKGQDFRIVIAVYADRRNTHYAEPLVVVDDSRIQVRVRTWNNDMIRTMDYRPRLISVEASASIENAGTYLLDIGYGIAGRIRAR